MATFVGRIGVFFMKKALSIIGAIVLVLVLIAVTLVFCYFCIEGFWQMINSRINFWHFLKFFGSGIIAGIMAGFTGILTNKIFKAIVNQDKWHKSMPYLFIRAVKIRVNRKLDKLTNLIMSWN